jgi:type II secretory pathway component PulJ
MSASDKGWQGYALIDVLMALLLFSLSFSIVYGLTETAITQNQKAANLTQAKNIARTKLEKLAARPWSENIAAGECLPGDTVVGSEGLFAWTLYAAWEEYPELLNIEIKVEWLEGGKSRSYSWETIYYVD